MGKPRIPHLMIEREQNSLDKAKLARDTVVLDASRIGDYLECPEAYRRKWEGEGYQEESEALVIGTDFHQIVSQNISTLMEKSHART